MRALLPEMTFAAHTRWAQCQLKRRASFTVDHPGLAMELLACCSARVKEAVWPYGGRDPRGHTRRST